MKEEVNRMRAGVVGDPIAHSLSPHLMQRWIEALSLNADYQRFHISADQFTAFIHEQSRTGLSGLNVTLPHKAAALDLAHEVSEAARAIGAVNLLTFKQGRIHGENTDARGFLDSLHQAGADPQTGPALVLGAGGAARAIIYALQQAGAPEIRIANRSRASAEALAGVLAPQARIFDWDDRDAGLADAALIVNATSLGLAGTDSDLQLDWSQASKSGAAVDSVYKPLQTGFLRDAGMAGLKTIDGLGMLIGQAKPSFAAFFGCPPPEAVDIRALLVASLEASA
jgi:shikimate dehydrogenase